MAVPTKVPGKKGGFMPGGGRPPSSTEALGLSGRVAAMRYADKAMRVLVDLLTSPQHSVRFAAAADILNRAYGKPAQALTVTGKDGGPIEHAVVHEAEQFTSTIAGLVARDAEERASSGTQH